MRRADPAARKIDGLRTEEAIQRRPSSADDADGCETNVTAGGLGASTQGSDSPTAAEDFHHDRSVIEAAFEAARMGVWECSLPDETLFWTKGVHDLFDLPRGVMPDRRLTLLCYDEETRAALVAARAEAIRTVSGFELDAMIVTARGARRWIRITATVQAKDGVPFRIFGIKRDITEERMLIERTRHLAEHDVLTGLKNRLSFNTRLDAISGRAPGDTSPQILMLLDLDGFKAVNDGLGHHVGDDVLRMAGERILACCGSGAFVARTGGDEFAVLLACDLDTARSLAARIVEAMTQPVVVAGTAIRVGVSIGIAEWKDGGLSSSLYMAADAALYEAKAAGRGTHRTFAGESPTPIDEVRPSRTAET